VSLPKIQPPEKAQGSEKKVQFPPVATPPPAGPALQGTVPSSLLSPQTGLPGDAQVRVRVSPDPVPVPVEVAEKEQPPVSPVRLQGVPTEATSAAKPNINGSKNAENKANQQPATAGPQLSKIVIPGESNASRPLYAQPNPVKPPVSAGSEKTAVAQKPLSEIRVNPQAARSPAAPANRSDSVRATTIGSVPTSTARPQKSQAAAPVRLGGPSFLGLGYDDVSDEDTRDSDDLYKANWGGRLAIVFIILGLAGGLAYLQWRSVHPLQAASSVHSTASQPAAQQPPASTKPESTPTTANSSASRMPAPDTDDPVNPSTSAEPDNGPSANKGDRPPSANTTGAGPTPDPASNELSSARKLPVAPAAPAASQPQAAVQPGAPLNKMSAAKIAPSAGLIREGHEVATGKSADDLEEPVRLAESYLQGRGVPRNCNAALGILRSASDRGNPRAEIKLGALYATGNCVAPDRVAAYRLFSRAMQAQPNNTWLEQSRSVLWGDMSDGERKQAMEVEK